MRPRGEESKTGIGTMHFVSSGMRRCREGRRQKEGRKNSELKSRGCLLPSEPAMAKKSWIERNKRKLRTVQKYAKIRAELKAKGDYEGLALLPRDASPTRLVNRCQQSGRRRGFIRRFGLSRIAFRELASQGMVPGVTKSSW